MFWLEGRVVTALAGDDDQRTGGAITTFVDSSLAAMPQHLRLGVALESVGLGAVGPAAARPEPGSGDDPPVAWPAGSTTRSASSASTRGCCRRS